jgi:hypothetical protein
MMMAVIMIVVVIMTVTMIVIRLRGFRLGISVHEGLDDLAQRILLEPQMAGQHAGEPREHQRLASQPPMTLVRAGLLGVAGAAAERIGEKLLHIGDGRCTFGMRLRLQERAGMGEEAGIQLLRQLARVFVDIAAHVVLLSS